ncbi:MAG: RNB domain-containing ribonuclease [Tenacibaculum sp.]|nr:RNB domain-containing ribonuclease [Tenacibaculum sp.]
MSKRKKIYKKKGKQIKDLTRKIFRILNNDNKSFNHKQIASKLDIKDTDGRNQIIKKLGELKSDGKIKESERGKYQLNEDRKYHIGTLDLTSNGNAYFICDDFEEDIFVPNVNVNHGLQGDLVRVYVYHKRKNKKLEADVVEIIERAKTEFVGTLQMSKNFGFVIPDNNKMYADIFISKSKIGDAQDGDKVVVKMTDWPENSKNPFGKITNVLGKPGEHDTEIHSILMEYGLPYEFPKEVEEYAKNMPIEITSEEIGKRRDMREDLTFTIDPKDAKDFDDALSFTELENGNYEIGIHIADVSHYVQPNTILDNEAYDRATSVYLVDRVVPMLPELLSNGVCSLRPNEEKLTFSAVFEMNDKAQIVNQWFGRTVTYSDKRFTYEQAQEIIENQEKNTKFVKNQENEETRNEISQQISERSNRTNVEENRTLEQIFKVESRRRSEENRRNAQKGSNKLSELDLERLITETFAKEKNVWQSLEKNIELGVPIKGGHENTNYLDVEDKKVYKVNNLLNNSGSINKTIDNAQLHNIIFPNTKLELVGFTGFDGRSVFPIFKQQYIPNATEASPSDIKVYMESLGFKQTTSESYVNDDFLVFDLYPRNVLKDNDGDIYVIDSEVKLIKNNELEQKSQDTENSQLEKAILKLDELAKKMRKERMRKGAISFDRVEVKFNLNEHNEPTGVYFKESKDANKLIEEFMLLANKKVAEFIGKEKGRPSNKTFIYRVHDEPNIEKLAGLQNIISKFGYKINTETREKTSQSLNKLLSEVKGKGEANMVETLTIRSMSKAEYTTKNIGHYGLAFDYYSHFTSPIRRYPDVMTHRLLQHYLDGQKSPNVEEYEQKCKHSSSMEELASKAERDSIKYMQIKYMQDHKNMEFKGVISGVTEWGIYVEIIENKCEGMVRIRDIKDDYYIYDEKQYAVVGQATQNVIQLGDEVTVKVKNTDLERKHLDFMLVDY